MNTTETVAREAFIKNLRDLATYLEERPTLPVPEYNRSMLVFIETKEEFQQIARAMGSAEKEFNDSSVSLIRRFGLIELKYLVERYKVCERRVVGTREIPASTEEIVEWSCSESILAE